MKDWVHTEYSSKNIPISTKEEYKIPLTSKVYSTQNIPIIICKFQQREENKIELRSKVDSTQILPTRIYHFEPKNSTRYI